MYIKNLGELVEIEKPLCSFTVMLEDVDHQNNRELERLKKILLTDSSFCNRKIAAQRIGNMHCPDSLPGLLEGLLKDPFWMVRCSIIQALEKLGDIKAIPTLKDVEKCDGIQIVRSYAAKAVERLALLI